MRHFLHQELASPFAVPSLSCRVQPASSRLPPVLRARTPNRFSSLVGSTARAESPTTIAASAESKLNATPSTDDKPKILRQHLTPRRRFLDMELALW
jgi:hypothetical protein